MLADLWIILTNPYSIFRPRHDLARVSGEIIVKQPRAAQIGHGSGLTEESDEVLSKSGSRILNASRPASKNDQNRRIALTGSPQNDVRIKTAC